jgi:hypothetical protein
MGRHLRFSIQNRRLAGQGGGYQANMDAIRTLIERHQPQYFVIENAGQNIFLLTKELQELCRKHNTSIQTVSTSGQSLTDMTYGLSALSAWFANGQIELAYDETVRSRMAGLVEELQMFRFDSDENGKYRGPKDRLMALWFAYRIMLTHVRQSNVVPFGRAAKLAPWVSQNQRSLALPGR